MANKIPNHIIRLIEDARKAATLENASFAFPKDTLRATRHGDAPFEGHPDAYIKETTLLYRASWIIGPLDEVLAWINNQSLNPNRELLP